MLVVDEATGHDFQEVARLAQAALQERYDPQWLAQRMETYREGCFVARDSESNELVGFALADKVGPCEGHLLALAVDRFHRHQGVGSALLKTVRDELAREGAYKLSLEVRVDDGRAKAFYTRHGFAPVGLMEHAYQDGAAAVRYARPL